MCNVNRRRYLSLWSMRGTLYYLKRINGKIDDNFVYFIHRDSVVRYGNLLFIYLFPNLKKNHKNGHSRNVMQDLNKIHH